MAYGRPFLILSGLIALALALLLPFKNYDLTYLGAHLSGHFLHPITDPPTYNTLYNASDFPWATHIRSHWKDIYAEFLAYEKIRPSIPPIGDVSTHDENLDYDKKWNLLLLEAYGQKTLASELFPSTMKVLKESGVESPLVMFSVLQPGKMIPPHKGYYSGVLRYHVALETPPPASGVCALFVHHEGSIAPAMNHTWVAGDHFLFDDTNLHYVANETPHRRVVLFLDILRHDVSPVKRGFNRIFTRNLIALTPGIRRLRENADKFHVGGSRVV